MNYIIPNVFVADSYTLNMTRGRELRPVRIFTGTGRERAEDRVVLATGCGVHRRLASLHLPVFFFKQKTAYEMLMTPSANSDAIRAQQHPMHQTPLESPS